jgi:dienelactone hydrolase
VAIARRMERALASAGKMAELVVYAGAHHRFDRGRAAPREGRAPSRSTLVFDEDAAKDAWGRSLAWFKTYLGQ